MSLIKSCLLQDNVFTDFSSSAIKLAGVKIEILEIEAAMKQVLDSMTCLLSAELVKKVLGINEYLNFLKTHEVKN